MGSLEAIFITFFGCEKFCAIWFSGPAHTEERHTEQEVISMIEYIVLIVFRSTLPLICKEFRCCASLAVTWLIFHRNLIFYRNVCPIICKSHKRKFYDPQNTMFGCFTDLFSKMTNFRVIAIQVIHICLALKQIFIIGLSVQFLDHYCIFSIFIVSLCISSSTPRSLI